MNEKIKQVTIKSNYLLVGGALIDLGKIWAGTSMERFIELQFIGGGKLSFLRDDGGEWDSDVSTIHLKPHLFDKLKAYLIANLKPIEIV